MCNEVNRCSVFCVLWYATRYMVVAVCVGVVVVEIDFFSC